MIPAGTPLGAVTGVLNAACVYGVDVSEMMIYSRGVYDDPRRGRARKRAWCGVIEHYRDFLPVTDRTPVFTLCEGNTPLILAPRLAEATDARLEIYLKCEGFNPTGSFKDRGMTMAMSKALEAGSRAVICASTGNTSASAAAYAARAGLKAFVMLPKGALARAT